MGRDEVLHGQARSSSGSSIYVSPSVEYAAFPTYSQFDQTDSSHWLQVVLQVRVRPGSYHAYPGTLGTKYWPEGIRFDANFKSLHDIEWLIEDESDVVVTGLLVRLVGSGDQIQTVFGETASQVVQGFWG